MKPVMLDSSRKPLWQLVAVAAALVFPFAPEISAQTTIGNLTVLDTFPNVDTTVHTLGEGDGAQSYGQTFVAPAGDSRLMSFEMPMKHFFGGRTKLDFMIFAWDDERASAVGDALYRDGPFVVAANQNELRILKVDVGGISLEQGQKHVAIFTVSGHFDGEPDGVQLEFVNHFDPYPDGEFVFLVNGDDLSRLTTDSWNTFFVPHDLAFRAVFGSTSIGNRPRVLRQTMLNETPNRVVAAATDVRRNAPSRIFVGGCTDDDFAVSHYRLDVSAENNFGTLLWSDRDGIHDRFSNDCVNDIDANNNGQLFAVGQNANLDALRAYDKRSGALQWSSSDEGSAILAGSRRIWVAGVDRIFAMKADLGQLIWAHEFAHVALPGGVGERNRAVIRFKQYLFAGGRVMGESSSDGYVAAFNAYGGRPFWEHRLVGTPDKPESVQALALLDSLLFVVGGSVRALDAYTGETVWEDKDNGFEPLVVETSGKTVFVAGTLATKTGEEAQGVVLKAYSACCGRVKWMDIQMHNMGHGEVRPTDLAAAQDRIYLTVIEDRADSPRGAGILREYIPRSGDLRWTDRFPAKSIQISSADVWSGEVVVSGTVFIDETHLENNNFGGYVREYCVSDCRERR